ncbi:hydantoinase/oxoprolinase family protein [Rhizobium sp. SGZ-381]|uniref:hydantoinase/oxoprolinase family protein n=1 Tax=Rhizobium sp. SGZ-381 TaxID=3342800 RepID=UPI00366E9367
MVYRIGCDVGGTFTDLCLFEEETGKTFFVKTPTTTGHQATAVVHAARTALGMAGIAADELSGFAHGTTVATNAILERRGARTALLITRGFRDVLAIGRQTRAHLYDQYARKPEPLVPREFVYEIGERLAPDGTVTEALDEETVRGAISAMLTAGIETVAISFLHSYANPAHERRAADIVRAMAPDLKISISSDVLAEPGEFERTSTTVMNAYLMPPLKDYLERIANTLVSDGVTVEPAIMQSGGGVMPIETASGVKAVHTCLSGPAAGMIGARRFAEAAGYKNVVTIDMGGTSFDVGLIEDGQILTRYESEIEGFPLRVPMFDIITLGAGGGSIAHVDAGGLLKVGPESAGARPGPAAYGKGGERPTVTDANVILGRLRPGREIGGGIVIDRERAARAVETHVAGPLGISVEEAAVGILQVVNAAMVRGMRRITVERGLEPRDFAVMAFGGAGPLHAVDLCAELDVETVIVPPSPGLLCGIGLLLAPWKHDETSMISGLTDGMSNSDIRTAIEILVSKIIDQANNDRIDFKSVTLAPVLEMRYRGQGHQLPIHWTPDGLDAAVEAFHQAHQRSFGYARRGESIEISMLRLSASAPPPSDRMPVPTITASDDPVIARSPLWFEGAMVEVPVYDRAKLAIGTELQGPLIVEQHDTTLIVGAQTLVVDSHGNLIIRMQK